MALINPFSGTAGKGVIPDMLTSQFNHSEFDLDVRITESAGHAFVLAEEAAGNDFYGVLAVGGDGTVNEVASALRDTQTALGIIPCGSGNGLARHLQIPLSPEDAISVIKADNIVPLDYCTANGMPFFCTCGFGFDAQVSGKFAKGNKRGPIGYFKSALSEYLRYRPQRYKITTPHGVLSEKSFLIACGNASQYGNNAYITPNASMQDGLIDVTVILPITPLDTALLGLLLFSRHIDQDTNIISFRTPALTIERESSGIIHLDGEPTNMPESISIECHPASLRVFTPTKPSGKNSILTTIESNFWNFIGTVRTELDI